MKERRRGGFKVHEELIFVHPLVSVSRDGSKGATANRFKMGKELVFHIRAIIRKKQSEIWKALGLEESFPIT